MSCDDAPPSPRGLDARRYRVAAKWADDFVASGRLPGVVVAFERDGDTFEHAAGAYQRDAIFRICSMTKAVVAVAAASVIEDGLLPLGLLTPVAALLPEFAASRVIKVCGAREGRLAPWRCPHREGEHRYRLEPVERNATVEDLLTHRGGFTYAFFGSAHFGKATKLDPPADVAAALYRRAKVLDGCHIDGPAAEEGVDNAENVRRLAAVPLAAQPGSRYTYGHDTDVLGRLLEVATRSPLSEVLRSRIFAPLGMNDTAFQLSPADGARRARLAPLYHYPAGEAERCDAPGAPDWCAHANRAYQQGSGLESGGCGLLSTSRDYLKLLRMLTTDGGRAADGSRVLGRAAVRAMTHGDRLAASDAPFQNLNKRLSSATAEPGAAAGWGIGLELGGAAGRRPNTQLESAPTFGWAGLHTSKFFGSAAERLAGVAFTQCHGYDPWCRERADELGKGLRDVAFGMLP